MNHPQRTYPMLWLLGGGLVFGVYFTLGLWYFDTFRSLDTGREMTFWAGNGAVLVLASTAVALLLYQGKAPAHRRRRISMAVGVVALAWGMLFLLGGWHDPAWAWNIRFLGRIGFRLLLVGLLPVVAMLVLLQGNGQRRPASQTASGDGQPDGAGESPPEDRTAWEIAGGPGGSQVQIFADELIFVEAADNYCKFHCRGEGKRKVYTVRIALKEVEKMIGTEPHFFRCHRSFMVNARQVLAIEGTSQAYKLRVQQFEDAVPVSRSFDLQPLRKHLPS